MTANISHALLLRQTPMQPPIEVSCSRSLSTALPAPTMIANPSFFIPNAANATAWESISCFAFAFFCIVSAF